MIAFLLTILVFLSLRLKTQGGSTCVQLQNKILTLQDLFISFYLFIIYTVLLEFIFFCCTKKMHI